MGLFSNIKLNSFDDLFVEPDAIAATVAFA